MIDGIDTKRVRYHLAELEITRTPGHPNRSLPQYDCTGWSVLDIGCGIGQTLLADEFKRAKALYGIDVDREAILYGVQAHPGLQLTHAPAEAIPYPDAQFDLVYSRVSIPYTRIKTALAEMYRVTKPGGRVWMTLHGPAMERLLTSRVIKARKWKDLVKRSYVWANGCYFALAGNTFCRPGSDVMESFQFEFAIRRAMRKAGFFDLKTEHEGTRFIVTAKRPRH